MVRGNHSATLLRRRQSPGLRGQRRRLPRSYQLGTLRQQHSAASDHRRIHQREETVRRRAGLRRWRDILLNDEKQKTANDDQNPTTLLKAKKAGKKIKRGDTVTLKVRNSDGTESAEFSFRRPVE